MALTAESITETALDILSRYGLGDLSMRRLARELEVQPSALYWHVENKQELLVLLATRMIAEVNRRCPPGTGARAAVLALRDVMLAYRDGAEIVLLGYSIKAAQTTPDALHPDLLGADRSAALVSFTLGAVQIEQNRGLFEITGNDDTDSFALGVNALLA
ncbi:TetR family transcriptional regulator [Brevibacterium sp.]|uniref:TetR family transcriptional regulator n=1 Tax=Brevibacterium sp. TaxID=1701 RepID=UPI002811F123|nr:TetR family transcriptional regulator [Brevibacterium sp.]